MFLKHIYQIGTSFKHWFKNMKQESYFYSLYYIINSKQMEQKERILMFGLNFFSVVFFFIIWQFFIGILVKIKQFACTILTHLCRFKPGPGCGTGLWGRIRLMGSDPADGVVSGFTPQVADPVVIWTPRFINPSKMEISFQYLSTSNNRVIIQTFFL